MSKMSIKTRETCSEARHSVAKITWGSFRGQHLGVGIISGTGIMSESGSFRGLYRPLTTVKNKK